METPSPTICKKTSRRNHTKSRSGCSDCKRRRVKCDEAWPACSHCARRKVSCSLTRAKPLSLEGSPSSDLSHSPNRRHVRSVFEAILMANYSPKSDYGDAVMPYDTPKFELSRLSDTNFSSLSNSRDQELMHHFCTLTVHSMSTRSDVLHIWRTVIPQSCYENDFVLHGILALSAAHKAYLLSGNRQLYLNLSDYHFNIGSETFRSQLSDEDERKRNQKPLFLFGGVVIIHILTSTLRTHNSETDAIENLVRLARAIKGFRVIIFSCLSWRAMTDLAALDSGSRPFTSKELAFQTKDVPPGPENFYEKATLGLKDIVNTLAACGVFSEVGMVLRWLYFLDADILSDIETLQPPALLLVAYFAVILASMEKTVWYLNGWGDAIIRQVDQLLEEDSKERSMFAWAKQQISRRIP
ncbi:C6 zinc finger domain-containing protein [Colletotrichum kahawae]|uniref:C6 zinc finger domain-containing protein n=1 Tax=Colletotrichum kahawae TaxID=34407 RepID=A0AAD9Y6K0_COLKA|nr:C6 zinc finger domain-containing protein [Colletotrichum kahawae]